MWWCVNICFTFFYNLQAKTFGLTSEAARSNAISKELKPLLEVLALVEIASDAKEQTFERCVMDAHALFFQYFRDRILSLQKAYPEDHIDSQGRMFWSGTKRFPHVGCSFFVTCLFWAIVLTPLAKKKPAGRQ